MTQLDKIESMLEEVLDKLPSCTSVTWNQGQETPLYPDDYKNWLSVQQGCSYDGGSLEADFTEQNVWRIKFTKGDFSFPTYLPNYVKSDTVAIWWIENHKVFLEDAKQAIEAYKEIA